MIPFALKYLFQKIIIPNQTFLLKCNFIEVFNEEIFDLLSNNTNIKQKLYLKMKKNGDYFLPSKLNDNLDVCYKEIRSLDDLNHFLNLGVTKKAITSNQSNITSSSSHVIFKLIMLNSNTQEEFTLSLVDLAGSSYLMNSKAKTILKKNTLLKETIY